MRTDTIEITVVRSDGDEPVGVTVTTQAGDGASVQLSARDDSDVGAIVDLAADYAGAVAQLHVRRLLSQWSIDVEHVDPEGGQQ